MSRRPAQAASHRAGSAVPAPGLLSGCPATSGGGVPQRPGPVRPGRTAAAKPDRSPRPAGRPGTRPAVPVPPGRRRAGRGRGWPQHPGARPQSPRTSRRTTTSAASWRPSGGVQPRGILQGGGVHKSGSGAAAVGHRRTGHGEIKDRLHLTGPRHCASCRSSARRTGRPAPGPGPSPESSHG